MHCWLHYIAYHSWRWRERDVAQPARSIGGMWGGDRWWRGDGASPLGSVGGFITPHAAPALYFSRRQDKTGDMCRRSSDKDSPHISSSQLCSSTVIPFFTSLSPHMHPCTHKQPLIYSSYYYMKQLYGALLIISTEPEKISGSAHQM